MLQIIKKLFSIKNIDLHQYRLVVVNEDTLDEEISISLSRKKVFIALASLFIVIFIIFSSIIFFTPLKYYIPGNNSTEVTRTKLIQMQRLSDSLILMNETQEKFILNILEISNGVGGKKKDTNLLNEKTLLQASSQNDSKIDRASRYRNLSSPIKDSNVDKTVYKKDSAK